MLFPFVSHQPTLYITRLWPEYMSPRWCTLYWLLTVVTAGVEDALAMSGEITGGTGPYSGARGILTYVGIADRTSQTLRPDYKRFVTVIANREQPDDAVKEH